MRRVMLVAVVLAVVVLGLVLGALSVELGARAVPESRLYVAISRSDDETAAREIEVIDTASGERSLFDVGARITALTLSNDRRTLYVGTEDGRLLLVEPTSGATYAAIPTRRASWILAPPGRDEVILVGSDPSGFSVTRVDVVNRREVKSVLFSGAVAGRPAISGGELLIPYVVPRENSLGRHDLVSLDRKVASQVRRITGRLALGLPQVHLTSGGSAAYLSQWDSSLAAVVLLTGVADEPTARELLLGVTSPGNDRLLRGLLEVQSSITSATDGALHICVGNAGKWQTMHAVYRRTCLPAVEAALSRGDLRVVGFFPDVRVRAVGIEEIQRVDHELRSLIDVDTPQELARARRAYGDSCELPQRSES